MLLRQILGHGLRTLRKARGLTLREVAESAHVSVSHLSEIERGDAEASSELLAAICGALGVELSELLELLLTHAGDAADAAADSIADAFALAA